MALLLIILVVKFGTGLSNVYIVVASQSQGLRLYGLISVTLVDNLLVNSNQNRKTP